MKHKIFFGKYYGKSIDELPSSYLIWLLEECDQTEWLTSQACKKELSERLKLDWKENPSEEELKQKLILAGNRIIFLEKLICMSVISKGNQFILDGYLNDPKLMESHIKLIRLVNEEG